MSSTHRQPVLFLPFSFSFFPPHPPKKDHIFLSFSFLLPFSFMNPTPSFIFFHLPFPLFLVDSFFFLLLFSISILSTIHVPHSCFSIRFLALLLSPSPIVHLAPRWLYANFSTSWNWQSSTGSATKSKYVEEYSRTFYKDLWNTFRFIYPKINQFDED